MTKQESCSNHEDIPNTVRKTMETTGLGEFLSPELVCLDIQTEIQIPGSPHSGEVLHLAQMHSSHLDGKKSVDIIYEHQKMIYTELKKAQPKYIMIEGDSGEIKELLSKIPSRVKGMDINHPLLKNNIYVLGGSFFYTLHNPSVILVPAENPNDSVVPYNQTGELLSKEELTIRRESQKNRRENYVLRQIKNIFDKDPRATIAIVYGAGHDFSKSFKESFGALKTPTLKRTRFPKAVVDRMKLLGERPILLNQNK